MGDAAPAPAAGPPASQPAAVLALSVVEEDRSPPDWTYAPAELATKVGTTPTWTNAGAEGHTVTSTMG
jgi:plastocyanin